MPNLKSAKKRMRVSARQRAENYPVRTRVRTFQRRFAEALEGDDQAAMADAFSAYCSVLDKAAKHNVIAKNTAIRSKTRAADRLRKATAKA